MKKRDWAVVLAFLMGMVMMLPSGWFQVMLAGILVPLLAVSLYEP